MLLLPFCAGLVISGAAFATDFPAPNGGNFARTSGNSTQLINSPGNYSSNPFFTPTSSYNQRYPQPVYATGADLTAADCNSTVSTLIARYCAANNCAKLNFQDINYAIANQLSLMPNHNYMSACQGYVETIFNEYKNNLNRVAPSAFPAEATKPAAFPTGSSMPESEFPETTYENMTFSERRAFTLNSMQNYKDLKAYNNAPILPEEPKPEQIKEEIEKLNNEEVVIDDNLPTPPPGQEYQDDLEMLMPAYYILVAKKGSLDSYAQAEVPIIPLSKMKNNPSEFLPESMGNTWSVRGHCTSSVHTAHDKDIINMAAHITQGEKDSFWSGNDFYVFDGSDMYWGWATIVGEVALAAATFGASTYFQAAANVTKAADTVNKTQKALKAAKAAKNAKEITRLNKLLKTQQATLKTAKGKKLATATANVEKTKKALTKAKNAAEIKKATTALRAAEAELKAAQSTKTFAGVLRTMGQKTITAPKRAGKYAKASWHAMKLKSRMWTVAGTGIAIGALNMTPDSVWKSIKKANGYSESSVDVGEYQFNSFGLLSGDALEDRENVVSHGAWLEWEDPVDEVDAFEEALDFAQAFRNDVDKVNQEYANDGRGADRLCDIDIYVVQLAIPNKNKHKDELHYLILNDEPYRVDNPKKQN